MGLFPTSEETKRRDPWSDCDLVVSVHYCSTWARWFTVQPMGLVMKIWWWNTEKQLGETIPIPWTSETTYHEHNHKNGENLRKISLNMTIHMYIYGFPRENHLRWMDVRGFEQYLCRACWGFWGQRSPWNPKYWLHFDAWLIPFFLIIRFIISSI